jgi:hypothetical protein
MCFVSDDGMFGRKFIGFLALITHTHTHTHKKMDENVHSMCVHVCICVTMLGFFFVVCTNHIIYETMIIL